MARLNTLLQIFVVLCLSACTAFASFSRIEPGQTRGAEVIARHGEPTRVWPEPDGGRTLEYSTQPHGTSCYMVRVGPDDRVLSVEDTLDDSGRGRVENGMTHEQVGHLLGTPRTIQTFRLSGEEVWDWTVPSLGAPLGIKRFNVHFKDGKVVRTSATMVYPDR